uniref:Uncharacterized protein n=1 Tax=Glossina austeni TaxID=7395 RepID=A0A1A9V8H8_GLOAU
MDVVKQLNGGMNLNLRQGSSSSHLVVFIYMLWLQSVYSVKRNVRKRAKRHITYSANCCGKYSKGVEKVIVLSDDKAVLLFKPAKTLAIRFQMRRICCSESIVCKRWLVLKCHYILCEEILITKKEEKKEQANAEMQRRIYET